MIDSNDRARTVVEDRKRGRERKQGRVSSFRPGTSMSKRTVLKVDTSCDKCKRKVLQAVSGLQGVDKIEIESEKSTVTVTGSVDPVDVVVATRKVGKRASVVTIGPPPPSSSSKPEEKKPEPHHQPHHQRQQEEKKYWAAAAERKAPEQPVTVYVHHVPVPPSWPAYEQSVTYQQDPCSIM